MFQNLIDIIAAPSAAFTRLKEKATIMLPLLLLLVSVSSVQVGYILMTDRGFLVDQQMDQIEGLVSNLSDEQLDQIAEQTRNQSAGAMIASSAGGAAVIIFIITALYALYLNFVSKFSFVQLGWKAWFSLVCWTSVPAVFGALASWAVLLSSSNGQVPLTDLNPLNFTNLLGLEPGGPLSQLGPLSLWSFALLALGYQNWTKKGLVSSAFISLAPYVLIYGIWGVVAM